MSESVVDMLKVIKVDVEQRALSACILGSFDIFGQILFTAHTVVKPC